MLSHLDICSCFRSSGKREIRNGTESDFCQNCGQPFGYHRPAEAMHWGNPKTAFGSGTAPQKEICAFAEELAWRFGRRL